MKLKKVATNIPKDLLDEAIRSCGLNQTQTIIAALRELVAQKKREQLLAAKGKITIKYDIKDSRQRKRT